MKKCYHIRIYGKVQGVWYRASTQRKANELGLTGFVQNKADGTVYAEAEGTSEALDALVAWCKEGPPFAKVTKVEFEESELVNFDKFEVRRG
jgi:acylphosphatase